MILNTTHLSKEQKLKIRELVGPSFSLFESFKMKGVGSKRMIIDKVSPNLSSYLSNSSSIKYTNIELRKEGILLFLNKRFEQFTWVIPYSQLVIFKNIGTSIHAQGRFIHFKPNRMLKENKNFLTKMIEEKVRYEGGYNFQSA